MIENPNPRNFYSEKEMISRQNYIPELKKLLLERLEDLTEKIQSEEPFPHGNMSLDDLANIDESVEEILNNWYY